MEYQANSDKNTIPDQKKEEKEGELKKKPFKNNFIIIFIFEPSEQQVKKVEPSSKSKDTVISMQKK